MIGWIIMLGWRSSGLSPVPSGGATGTVVNGEALKSITAVKKAPKPSRTATA